MTDYEVDGKFREFPFSDWNNFSELSDSTYMFETSMYKGIYDHRHKRYIIDSCLYLNIINDAGIFIANKEITQLVDTANREKIYDQYGNPTNNIQIQTGMQLYSIDGNLLSEKEIAHKAYNYYDADGNVDENLVLQFYTTYDYKYLIFMDKDEKWGVLDREGKIKIPFRHKDIDATYYPKGFVAVNEDGSETTYACKDLQ